MLEMFFETAAEVFFCFKLLLENFKRVLILLNRIIRLWERGRAKGLQPGATLPVNSELIIDDFYVLSIGCQYEKDIDLIGPKEIDIVEVQKLSTCKPIRTLLNSRLDCWKK